MIQAFIDFIVYLVELMGYWGIFVMTALESTFLPIPSEITLIPAGYLIYEGKMDPVLVFSLATAGTLVGSLVNYAIAYYLGRRILIRYGRFFMMNEEKLAKMEGFFMRHGSLSVFLGRLILGVRHYISFPAGLARMNLKKFCIYTTIGGAIWIAILLTLGYMIGGNEHLLAQALPAIKLGMAVMVLAIAGFLVFKARKNQKRQALAHQDEAPQPPLDDNTNRQDA